ncbi:MAG TPA: 2OG-Fe(II) oxygenase [Sphingomonadaceae bacterium]|nr:2OG-Fe(II) oxygenase [Sphingomonadaceae bacterium]
MSKRPYAKHLPNPDKAALVRVGEQVRQRIEAHPTIYRMPTEKAELFALGEFMSEAECARMRGLIDQVAKPSKAFSASYSSAFRTSYSGDVDPWDPFVRKIERRFNDLLGIDPSFGETIQGQRYLPGQEFRAHCDWFYTDADYWPNEAERGGQRSWTAMVYLNPVEDGGTTDFVELGLSIQPKTGVLLLWNNATPDGTPNIATLHAATPVVAGEKYIITKWYRTRKWG